MKREDIICFEHIKVKQAASTDDLNVAEKTVDLKKRWDLLEEHGPKIVYFSEQVISYVKSELFEQTVEAIRGSGKRDEKR